MKPECHKNPDMWFRNMPQARNPIVIERVLDDTMQAIQVCSTCPLREKCLELGMDEENITTGVWGGLLAGERMVLAGHKPSQYRDGSYGSQAFNMLHLMRLKVGV